MLAFERLTSFCYEGINVSYVEIAHKRDEVGSELGFGGLHTNAHLNSKFSRNALDSFGEKVNEGERALEHVVHKQTAGFVARELLKGFDGGLSLIDVLNSCELGTHLLYGTMLHKRIAGARVLSNHGACARGKKHTVRARTAPEQRNHCGHQSPRAHKG